MNGQYTQVLVVNRGAFGHQTPPFFAAYSQREPSNGLVKQLRQGSKRRLGSPQPRSRRRGSVFFSNQFANRFAVIDEVLWSSRLIGDCRVADVDAEPVVKRGEDFLIVDRAILRDFTKSVR